MNNSNKAMFTSPEDVYINNEGKAVDRKSPDRFMKLVAAGQAIPLDEAVRAGCATANGSFLTPNIPDDQREPVETLIATDKELGKGPKASDDKKLTKANEEIATLKKQIEELEADAAKAKEESEADLKKVQDELTKANEEIATLKAAKPADDKAIKEAPADKAIKAGDNK